MLDERKYGDGTFPDVAFLGSELVVVKQVGNNIEVYKDGLLSKSLSNPSDLAFCKLTVAGNRLWLAYRNKQDQGIIYNLTDNTEVVFADKVDGNSPILLERGVLAWQADGVVKGLLLPVFQPEAHTLTLRGETRPTGLSRIEAGKVMFIDEDRLAINGHTIPTFAGPLSASEGQVAGAFITDGKKELTLWPQLEAFVPRIISDGERFAVVTWGSHSVRSAVFTLDELKIPMPNKPEEPKEPLPTNIPDHTELVKRIDSQFPDRSTDRAIFDVPLHVAWELRNEGCGLVERVGGGEGIAIVEGKQYSIKRVAYPDGRLFKVLSDAGVGGTNGPQWADEGFLDPNRADVFSPAIDPSKLGSAPIPVPTPTDPTIPNAIQDVKQALESIAKRLNTIGDSVEELKARNNPDLTHVTDIVTDINAIIHKGFAGTVKLSGRVEIGPK